MLTLGPSPLVDDVWQAHITSDRCVCAVKQMDGQYDSTVHIYFRPCLTTVILVR